MLLGRRPLLVVLGNVPTMRLNQRQLKVLRRLPHGPQPLSSAGGLSSRAETTSENNGGAMSLRSCFVDATKSEIFIVSAGRSGVYGSTSPHEVGNWHYDCLQTPAV